MDEQEGYSAPVSRSRGGQKNDIVQTDTPFIQLPVEAIDPLRVCPFSAEEAGNALPELPRLERRLLSRHPSQNAQ